MSRNEIELSREPAPGQESASAEAEPASPKPEGTPYRVSPTELLAKRREAATPYVFDLRDVEAYQEWHLPGAFSLPFEYLEPNLHRMPFAGDLLFYDGGEGTAAQAAGLLDENGFTDQLYMDEGADALHEALVADPAEVKYETLSEEERRTAIERVLDEKVRDFLASDGGGMEVISIENDRLLVSYQGACGGCASSTSGTLRFIQNTLTIALNHEIEVVPT